MVTSVGCVVALVVVTFVVVVVSFVVSTVALVVDSWTVVIGCVVAFVVGCVVALVVACVVVVTSVVAFVVVLSSFPLLMHPLRDAIKSRGTIKNTPSFEIILRGELLD